jgi:hypothetical protein
MFMNLGHRTNSPLLSVSEIVNDFAEAMQIVDKNCPQAGNARTGVLFRPGIGPHSEAGSIKMVIAQLQTHSAGKYGDARLNVSFPNFPRQRCDIVVGSGAEGWAIEAKLLRILGDNGKPNDNMLMHILSPYLTHRSAVTDCAKLLASGFHQRKAILIFGYESEEYPMLTAIEAFESFASRSSRLGKRAEAEAANLRHPVHRHGRVFGWEIQARSANTGEPENVSGSNL